MSTGADGQAEALANLLEATELYLEELPLPAGQRRRFYVEVMDRLPIIEDSRGVDGGQIRRQLRMSVEDRVRHMVDVTNKLMEVRETARLLDPLRVR